MSEGIINFVEKRNEAIERRRREFERLLFRNFLGVYTALRDDGQIIPIEIIDISDKGCQIQLPYSIEYQEKLSRKTDVSIRIYFTEKAYISNKVRIIYINNYFDSNSGKCLKCGCEFDKSTTSYKALESFINFLHNFAQYSLTDRKHDKILRL